MKDGTGRIRRCEPLRIGVTCIAMYSNAWIPVSIPPVSVPLPRPWIPAGPERILPPGNQHHRPLGKNRRVPFALPAGQSKGQQ
jgi:hypothetical protein